MGLKLLLIGLLVAVCIQVSLSVLSMKPLVTLPIPYDIVPNGGKTRPMYALNRGAAEKSAFDVNNMVAYTAGRQLLHVINFTDVYNPKIERSFRVQDPILDIAECGNLVAFTSRPRLIPTDPGMVHIYQKYPVFDSLCNMTVGSNPKSLKFDYKCDTIIIANEGPAAENMQQETFVNPEGTISVARVNNTMVHPSLSMCQPLPYGSDVRTIDFRLFNDPSLAPLMEQQFIRHPYKGQMDGGQHTFSMSVEPEYVTMDPWQPTAWVTLQENNAIAEVSYENLTAIIHPLGLKNWTSYEIDASMEDVRRRRGGLGRGIKYNRYPIESLLQPDAVEMMNVGNEMFLVTANEGAPLAYECESCEVETEYIEFEEAAELAGDYLLSDTVPNSVRTAMNDPSKLGQLRVSLVDGLREQGSEMIDRPVFFGGRGISMFRVSPYGLDLVWDSGDAISKGIQDFYPNAHNHPPFGNANLFEEKVAPADPINRRWDMWSPYMGPECQSLAIGQYNLTHKIIVVGINGANALGLFTVPLYSNYTEPVFESVFRNGEIRGNSRMTYDTLYRADVQSLQRHDVRGTGDLDPDSIVFIPAENSVGRVPLVLVTSRVSGTLTMYQLYEIPRHQLLKQQRTALDGSAGCIAPSTTLSLVFSLLTLFYVTLRH